MGIREGEGEKERERGGEREGRGLSVCRGGERRGDYIITGLIIDRLIAEESLLTALLIHRHRAMFSGYSAFWKRVFNRRCFQFTLLALKSPQLNCSGVKTAHDKTAVKLILKLLIRVLGLLCL